MKHRITVTLAVAALFLTAAFAAAVEKTGERSAAAGTLKGASKEVKTQPRARLVDINKAGKAELKTLPGITDAYAGRIVSGRPYLSKADLVTNNILPAPLYAGIKKRIFLSLPPNANELARKAINKK